MTSTVPFSRSSSAGRASSRSLGCGRCSGHGLGSRTPGPPQWQPFPDHRLPCLWEQPYFHFSPSDWRIFCIVQGAPSKVSVRTGVPGDGQAVPCGVLGFHTALALTGPRMAAVYIKSLPAALWPQLCCSLAGLQCALSVICCFPVTLAPVTWKKPWQHQPCSWETM